MDDARADPLSYIRYKYCIVNGGRFKVTGAVSNGRCRFVNVMAPYLQAVEVVEGRKKKIVEKEPWGLFPAEVQYFFTVDMRVRGKMETLSLVRLEWPSRSNNTHPYGYPLYHVGKNYAREADKIMPLSLLQGFVILAPYDANSLVCIPLLEVF